MGKYGIRMSDKPNFKKKCSGKSPQSTTTALTSQTFHLCTCILYILYIQYIYIYNPILSILSCSHNQVHIICETSQKKQPFDIWHHVDPTSSKRRFPTSRIHRPTVSPSMMISAHEKRNEILRLTKIVS